MSEDLEVDTAALPLALEGQVDKLCDEFEDALKGGVLPDTDNYLAQVPECAQRYLLHEIVKLLCNYAVVESRPPRKVSNGIQFGSTSCNLDSDSAIEHGRVPVGSWPQAALRAFGDFDLIERIGQGGMGTVYRAYQRSMRRTVAVKLLSAAPDDDSRTPGRESLLNRFRREAQATARLQNPNVVAVYEVGDVAGQPYYAMQFVDGQSLAEIVAEGPLEGRRAAGYLHTVANAIHEFHLAGILHRDLKPSNILIETRTDQPVVTDLGLAKLIEGNQLDTATGTCFGSPPYMSPEQVRDSRNVNAASDVYGLGATLYHLIAGRPPFLAATAIETVEQVVTLEPVAPHQLNPAIDRDLSTICAKCLSKDPSGRYESALSLAADLDRYLKGQPIKARPVSRIVKIGRWAKRNQPTAVLASVAIVSLLAGTGMSTALYIRAEISARQANAAATTSRRQLSQLCVANANAATGGAALPWLSRALVLDSGDQARETVGRIRLAAALATSAQLDQLWFHQAPVTHVDTDRAGRLLLSASDDGTAVLHYVEGRTDSVILNHGVPVAHAALNHDGSCAATAGTDGTVQLWDLPSGERRGHCLHHAAAANYCAFSSSGSHLATASSDGTAQIHSAEPVTNATLQHPAGVLSCSFSPDASCLLTTCADSFAYLWDVRAQKQLQRFPHRGVMEARFNADGSCVLTASDSMSVQAWSTLDAVPLCPAPLVHTARVECINVSSDGRHVVTGSADGAAWIWEAKTWKLLRRIEHPQAVTQVAFSSGNRQIVTVCADSGVRVWDRETGQLVVGPMLHARRVSAVAVDPAGQWLATASKDHGARLWGVSTGGPRELPGSVAKVCDCVLSSDRTRIVLPGQDHAAKLIDLKTGATCLLPHDGQVTCAQFDRNSPCITTGSLDGTITEWDVRGPAQIHRRDHGAKLYCLAVSPDGALATVGAGGYVRFWGDGAADPPYDLETHTAIGKWIAFSSNGLWLSAAVGDVLYLWNARAPQPVLAARWQLTGIVASAAFDPCGEHLAATTADGQIFIREATGRQQLQVGRPGMPLFVVFDDPGERLLVGRDDAIAEVIDSRTGQTLASMRHDGGVVHGGFDRAGLLAVTADRSGSVRVWDASTGELVRKQTTNARAPIRTFFGASDATFFVCTSRGQVALWDNLIVLNPIHELEACCQLLSSHTVVLPHGAVPLAPEQLVRAWRTARPRSAQTSHYASANDTTLRRESK